MAEISTPSEAKSDDGAYQEHIHVDIYAGPKGRSDHDEVINVGIVWRHAAGWVEVTMARRKDRGRLHGSPALWYEGPICDRYQAIQEGLRLVFEYLRDEQGAAQ